jgi:hypothetical protein
VSNREDIGGPGGDQSDRSSVKYAAAALPAPSSVPQRRAKRRKDQRVRAVARQVRRTAPHLDNQAFAPLLQGFARVSILLTDAYEKIRDQELLGPDGELRPSIETIRRLVDTQSRLGEKLGLTPATLRALGSEKKADLAAAFAEVEDAEQA